MNTEDEIKKLKKQVYDLEQTITNILPLGDRLELRVKALEASLPPSSSPPCVPPTQP
jgi:hypothetical protein